MLISELVLDFDGRCPWNCERGCPWNFDGFVWILVDIQAPHRVCQWLPAMVEPPETKVFGDHPTSLLVPKPVETCSS